MPMGMFQAQAVYINNRVYVGGGSTGDSLTDSLVMEYDTLKDSWKPLPPTYCTNFGLCKMLGEVVIIGGIAGTKTISLVSVFDTFTKRWKDSLPSLEDARYSPSCASVPSAMIVCGGISPSGEVLSSIEVIKSDTFQWYIAGYLPRSATRCYTSAVVIHDRIYVMGGYNSFTASSATNTIHSTSIKTLLSYASMTPFAWDQMPSTPNLQSTACSIGSCLLSLGGTSKAYMIPVHQGMHAYSPGTKSWLYVGDLPYAVCHSTAISLPNNELFVMGGWVQPGRHKRSCKLYKGSITT